MTWDDTLEKHQLVLSAKRHETETQTRPNYVAIGAVAAFVGGFIIWSHTKGGKPKDPRRAAALAAQRRLEVVFHPPPPFKDFELFREEHIHVVRIDIEGIKGRAHTLPSHLANHVFEIVWFKILDDITRMERCTYQVLTAPHSPIQFMIYDSCSNMMGWAISII